MICRVFGPKPGVVIVGFAGALGLPRDAPIYITSRQDSTTHHNGQNSSNPCSDFVTKSKVTSRVIGNSGKIAPIGVEVDVIESREDQSKGLFFPEAEQANYAGSEAISVLHAGHGDQQAIDLLELLFGQPKDRGN